MPNARSANAVRLEFMPDCLVQTNLSGAAFTGDWLWVAGDEACGLDRLRRLEPTGREALRLGEVRDFPLADLLDLPGDAGEEADLEGMAVTDCYLWVVGSHGLKRKNAKPYRDHADHANRLAKVSLDGNRRLPAIGGRRHGRALFGATGPRRPQDPATQGLHRPICSSVRLRMTPISGPTWRFRARTMVLILKAWRSMETANCWVRAVQ